MRQLVTINDLKQPHEVKQALITRAMQLSKYYTEFKADDTHGYRYEVEVGSDHNRAAGIHASEASRCQRQLVYSIVDTERRNVDRDKAGEKGMNMRMRFAIGHAVHAMLQSDMERMCERFNGSITFEKEVRINPEVSKVAAQWNIQSSCDGVFTFWWENVPYLRVGLEIKTKSHAEYEKITKPDEEHVKQTTLYMKTLDLPLMWILYYNKSNSNYTKTEAPWLMQFNETIWNDMEKRFHTAYVAVNSGMLPPRDESYACRWCPFAWTCEPPSLERKDDKRRLPTQHGVIRVPR